MAKARTGVAKRGTVGTVSLASTAIVFCTLWSSAFIAGKAAMTATPPLWLLTGRFLIAGGLMAVAARALGMAPISSARSAALRTAVALGVLNNTLYLGMSFYALQSLPAGFVVVIVSTAPIITAVVAHFTLAEPLTPRKLLGLALSVVGVWLIMRGRFVGGDAQVAGLLLVVLSAVALASGTIIYKRYGHHAPALWLNAWSTLVGGFVLLPVAAVIEDASAIHWNATLWVSLGYLVLVVSIGAMLIWFWLIRHAGAGRASAFHFLNPAIGVLLGWLVLAESPRAHELLGVLPVMLGVLLVVTRPRCVLRFRRWQYRGLRRRGS